MDKIGSVKSIKDQIKKHDFHIKKKYGQNFLSDQNILKNIASIGHITKQSLVVEVGPGLGSLTEHLIDKARHVLAYEIDADLIPILQEHFIDKSLTLIHGDYLERDIDQDIKDLSMEFDNVILVANLPYYITTPIIMKTLEESQTIKELVVMMQLEVAKRFTSKPSTKDYNSLSVVIQFKTDSSIAMKVPKTVFVPAPNVDSAVVHMKVKEIIKEKPNDFDVFFKLVRSSFVQRRKTLVNNLSTALGKPKEDIIQILVDLDYKPDIRAEKLSVLDFVKLSNKFNREIL
jgi:16S rRNA (adenine1518-N6/adenine1519-N6)-dimethyltransferase